MVDVQHTHDDAFGPQAPAKQIGCTDGHRRGLSSTWEVHTNWLHDLGRMQAMQRLDSRSEGVVDVLAAVMERGGRAAHAR